MCFFDYVKYDPESYEHAKDHFLGLLENVFKIGNVDDIERHLDELCCYFELDMPKGDPVIAKKRTEAEIRTERMLQSWVGETRAYAELFCNSRKKGGIQ